VSITTPDAGIWWSESRRGLLSVIGTELATALAGCSTNTTTPTDRPEEATVTIRLRNRDREDREYEVVVKQGDSVIDSFSGVLPPNQEQSVEMRATVRATDEQHDFSISSAGGQVGRTWDPHECDALFVDAVIENGEPAFTTECRSGQ
jgi:hypothetical protein